MEIQDINLRELIENETGQTFNKEGYIKCPFHSEKTPSLKVKFFPDRNKEKFTCFGCGETGDAIDFIIKYKNLKFKAAKKYLGFQVEDTEEEKALEKVTSFIQDRLKNNKNQELLGIFTYVDKANNPVYFKAKFLDKEKGCKNLFYYHIENGKVINKRGTNEELPYNYYNLNKAIAEDKIIIIVEGEKDANTVNSMLRNDNYVATSLKGVKKLSFLYCTRIYVISDTGKAGEKYKWDLHRELFHDSKEFKFINLPGLKSLGDNKDVTDWLELGHIKDDLLKAFNRSLNLKSKFDLQQDKFGIYKICYKGKGEDAEEYKKYLTDFQIIEVKRMRFIDEDSEGIRLIVKSPTDDIIERVGKSIVFDDTRSFKNFLGTIDLSFKGNADELTELKAWLNKYFALEVEETHTGVKFHKIGDSTALITTEGTILQSGYNTGIKADNSNRIDIYNKEHINAEELKSLKKNIFKFLPPEKALSIIGTIVNNLCVLQCEELGEKLHHMLIVGESGAGKSTIAENIIIPILNYPKTDIKVADLSKFQLEKDLSTGNYTLILNEFKPSQWDQKKVKTLSGILRNSYDHVLISKGTKGLESKHFYLKRPVIIIGEETYPNQETALVERSCIVYFSKNDRTKESSQAVSWLKDNKEILNKFGRSLVDIILNLSGEKYRDMRAAARERLPELRDRPQNTAINICAGLEIINILFKQQGLTIIKDYEKHIVANIKHEILEDSDGAHSIVEQMLIMFNDLLDNERIVFPEKVLWSKGSDIRIKTSEMVNQIHEQTIRVNADIIPLKYKDFKTQAIKSGYIIEPAKSTKIDGKSTRMDVYNRKKMERLNLHVVAPPLLTDITGEVITPFQSKVTKLQTKI